MSDPTEQFRALRNHEREMDLIWRQINKSPVGEQMLREILNDSWVSCDVDASTLYMGGYKQLSEIIPLRMPVYDFGAAYGFQSWWFKKHKRYIGINPPNSMTKDLHFRTDNSHWYFGSAQEFFKQFGVEKDSFAIVNAVPDDRVAELVKKHFKYCYIFYV